MFSRNKVNGDALMLSTDHKSKELRVHYSIIVQSDSLQLHNISQSNDIIFHNQII